MQRSRHRPTDTPLPPHLAGSIVKKSKQRIAKAAARKRRGKELKRDAPVACSDARLPAWPSLAQLRDRLQGSTVAEADSYRFEQSLQ
jgi:hypothetical protein